MEMLSTTWSFYPHFMLWKQETALLSPSDEYSTDDPSHTSGNNHGIVLAIVLVVIIIIIAVASYVCSRAFCSVQYHCREPSHGNNPLRGQSSDNLQLAEEGRINSEGSRRKGNRDTSRSCCSICQADYREDDELKSLLDCNHLFHKECIDQWPRLHPTCPICRKPPLPTHESAPLVLTEAAPFRFVISAP